MERAARRFAELINRPSADRHLDLLCALAAAAVDPAADVGSVLVALDRLAEGCPADFHGIIDTLFASGLFCGDTDDYHDPRNSLIHEVLARRVGMPITLSVVAIEVGRRLAVPIAGVGLPGHFVVRDLDSGTFADPFASGLRHDAADMIASWQQRMGGDAPILPSMLVPSTTHDIVIRILNNLKHSLLARRDSVMLARLVPLRAAFPELTVEADEHRRWMRHFN